MTTMMKKSITVKVDPTLKNEADDILDQMGLTMTTLFTMTLKQIVSERQLPFVPKAKSSLEIAMAEMQGGDYQSFENVHDLFEDLNDED